MKNEINEHTLTHKFARTHCSLREREREERGNKLWQVLTSLYSFYFYLASV